MNTGILIIGAGPSGCSAGINALKHGLDCVIVDKCKFPREKLCGGLITEEAIKEIRNMGVLIDNKIFYKPTKIRFFNQTDLIIEFINDTDSYVVNRFKFDNYMLNEFISKGGIFIDNERLIDIDIDNKIAKFNSGREIHYNYLIGADGVNSKVRKKINKEDLQLALCLEKVADKKESYDGVNVYFNIAKQGFSWIFENEDYASIGTGNLYRKNFSEIQENFEDICKINNINSEYNVKGAFVPYGKIAKNIVLKNIILVGDAGGFVDSILGEGIKYALITGRYAIESIISNDYKKAYLKKIKLIKKHIFTGNFLQKVFFNKFVNKFMLILFKIDKASTIRLTKEVVLKGAVKYNETVKLIKIYFNINKNNIK